MFFKCFLSMRNHSNFYYMCTHGNNVYNTTVWSASRTRIFRLSPRNHFDNGCLRNLATDNPLLVGGYVCDDGSQHDLIPAKVGGQVCKKINARYLIQRSGGNYFYFKKLLFHSVVLCRLATVINHIIFDDIFCLLIWYPVYKIVRTKDCTVW